jgi:hypothetical protein
MDMYYTLPSFLYYVMAVFVVWVKLTRNGFIWFLIIAALMMWIVPNKDVFILLLLTAVFIVWIKLTKRFWRFWRDRRRKMAEAKCGATQMALFDIKIALVALVWLAVSFWYGGGNTLYYDPEVDRLCAIDGGVKVYGTVILPPDKFHKQGGINFFRSGRGQNALGLEYVYKETSSYIRKRNPSIEKRHIEAYRKHDMRLLGESIAYNREGRSVPGGGYFDEYKCPSYGTPLFDKLFVMKKKQDS